MTEYFPSQFANNPPISGVDHHLVYEDEASSSAASTSPIGDITLGFPQGVDPTTVYYAAAHQQVPMFMGAGYDYYGTPSYSQTYVNQPQIPYNASLSADDRMYLQHEEQAVATPSPTSSMSSSSYPNYSSNVYLDNPRENSILTDPSPQDGVEHMIASPAFDGPSYRKKKTTSSISAFSNLSLGNSSNLVNNSSLYDKQHYEPKSDIKSEYSPYYKHHDGYHNQRQHEKTDSKKLHHSKKQSRAKGKKKCSNCHATDSPSWRRSICKSSKGDLVCNACGLYEKTAKRKRMLVTNDDGTTKVVRKRDPRGFCCSKCGAKDSTRWRKLHDDTVHCEKCVRGRK